MTPPYAAAGSALTPLSRIRALLSPDFFDSAYGRNRPSNHFLDLDPARTDETITRIVLPLPWRMTRIPGCKSPAFPAKHGDVDRITRGRFTPLDVVAVAEHGTTEGQRVKLMEQFCASLRQIGGS
jgi:hypothetical protein